jgi:pyrrolidone-carboxylate peptidase
MLNQNQRMLINLSIYYISQVVWHLMDYLARMDIKIPAGFIHFPRLPEQALDGALPSMSLDISARAMEVVVETLSGLLG